MNLVIFLISWAFPDLLDQWVLRERKETPDQEDLKAERGSRDPQVSMGSPVSQETQACRDLRVNKAPREASRLRWLQDSMKNPV